MELNSKTRMHECIKRMQSLGPDIVIKNTPPHHLMQNAKLYMMMGGGIIGDEVFDPFCMKN